MRHALINRTLNGIESPRQKSLLTCEPVTLGMGAMAAGSAVTNILGQQQAQKIGQSVEEARRIEQENVVNETRRRATSDYLNQTRLEGEQQIQEEAAVAQKGMDITKQTTRTVATGTASAAERGVAGRTVNAIASDYEFMANEETGRIKANQALANQQHTEHIKGFGTEYSNRIADVRPYVMQPQKPVDYFGPIFGAGAQTLQTSVAVKKASQ